MQMDLKEKIKKISVAFIFAIAMGYLEAVVVVYLRRILPPFDEMIVGSVTDLERILTNYKVYFIS